MLRVEDVDQTAAAAAALGGRIVQAPSTQMYGERQCGLLDPWGMRWTLSETVSDVAPEDWLKPG
jgi:PhnB protein